MSCCLLTEVVKIIVNQDLRDTGVQLLSQKAELVLKSPPKNISAIPISGTSHKIKAENLMPG